MSEDVGIEPKTVSVASFALADALITRLDLIHKTICTVTVQYSLKLAEFYRASFLFKNQAFSHGLNNVMQ